MVCKSTNMYDRANKKLTAKYLLIMDGQIKSKRLCRSTFCEREICCPIVSNISQTHGGWWFFFTSRNERFRQIEIKTWNNYGEENAWYLLKWYYDHKIISFFSSNFESVFAKHPAGKILSFVFYPKAVYFECKFWISRSAIAHVQNWPIGHQRVGSRENDVIYSLA